MLLKVFPYDFRDSQIRDSKQVRRVVLGHQVGRERQLWQSVCKQLCIQCHKQGLGAQVPGGEEVQAALLPPLFAALMLAGFILAAAWSQLPDSASRTRKMQQQNQIQGNKCSGYNGLNSQAVCCWVCEQGYVMCRITTQHSCPKNGEERRPAGILASCMLMQMHLQGFQVPSVITRKGAVQKHPSKC